MAITFVNSVQNSGTGTSLTLAMPGGGPGAANLIALSIRLMAGVTITSLTDTLGHDWSQGIPENPFAVGSDHVDYIRYVGLALPGANTITINTSSSALICLAEMEFAGFGPFGATLDQHSAATATSATADSGAVNTSDAAEAFVGLYTGATGNILTTDGTPNNWSAREDAATHKLQVFSQQFAATQVGAKLHGTVTSEQWGALVASFRASTGGPPVDTDFLMTFTVQR